MKSSPSKISTSEWLSALRDAEAVDEVPEDYKTHQAWAVEFNCSEGHANRILKKAVALKKATVKMFKIRRVAVSRPTAHYKLL